MNSTTADEIPETWHETEPETVREVEAWIKEGHPELCHERLDAIVKQGEARYTTARALVLAHAIREHGEGLDTLADALETQWIHGESARPLQEAIRDHGARFADEILELWGTFSDSPARLTGLGMVLHALRKPSRDESNPGSINQLAKQSGASFSWVHEIVSELASRGWVDKGDDVTVTKPMEVFEWWAENRTDPEAQTFHVTDPSETAEKLLHDMGVDHAITTYYAENALQGHLYPRRLDTYVRANELDRAREAIIELGGSLGGTNFRLLIGEDAVIDEGVVGEGSLQLLYAPLPQVILDLISEGGSAREAADLLIQRAYADA